MDRNTKCLCKMLFHLEVLTPRHTDTYTIDWLLYIVCEWTETTRMKKQASDWLGICLLQQCCPELFPSCSVAAEHKMSHTVIGLVRWQTVVNDYFFPDSETPKVEVKHSCIHGHRQQQPQFTTMFIQSISVYINVTIHKTHKACNWQRPYYKPQMSLVPNDDNLYSICSLFSFLILIVMFLPFSDMHLLLWLCFCDSVIVYISSLPVMCCLTA